MGLEEAAAQDLKENKECVIGSWRKRNHYSVVVEYVAKLSPWQSGKQ